MGKMETYGLERKRETYTLVIREIFIEESEKEREKFESNSALSRTKVWSVSRP